MKILLIDLDRTLYPPENAMFTQMGVRITEYIQTVLKVSHAQAVALRKQYWKMYGLTLIGLIKHHQVDTEDFLHFVHDVVPEIYIHPNPRLAREISLLPFRKILFTNSCRYYAKKVLLALEMNTCFDTILDIRAMRFYPKPHPKAYEMVLNRFSVSGSECMLVDDSLDNLYQASSMGMMTIWVGKGEWPPGIDGHACLPDDIPAKIKRLL